MALSIDCVCITIVRLGILRHRMMCMICAGVNIRCVSPPCICMLHCRYSHRPSNEPSGPAAVDALRAVVVGIRAPSLLQFCVHVLTHIAALYILAIMTQVFFKGLRQFFPAKTEARMQILRKW